MSRENKLKIKLLNRKALIRLTVLGMILSAIISWAWLTAISMPGKTYSGALPPLTQ